MTLLVLRRLLVLGVAVALALPGVGYVQTMNRAALVVQFEDGSSRNMCVAFSSLKSMDSNCLNYRESTTSNNQRAWARQSASSMAWAVTF